MTTLAKIPRIREIKPETEEKYRQAIELYCIICSFFLAFSSLRKMKDMANPITTDNSTVPITRAHPTIQFSHF